MSLPFFSSFARNSNTLSCKRIKVRGQRVGTPQVRRSVDGAPRTKKRNAADLLYGSEFDDVELAHVDLEFHDSQDDHQHASTCPRLKVGVVGVGKVGRSVAMCLAAKPGRVEVAVYNRTARTADSLFHVQGIARKKSVADVCAWADVVIVCVADYQASATLFDDPAVISALAGRTVVQLVHGTPQQANEAADIFGRASAEYLDGCWLGSPAMDCIGSSDVCIVTSGSKKAWKRAESVLKVLAPKSFWTGHSPSAANAINYGLDWIVRGFQMVYLRARQLCADNGVPSNVLPALTTGSYLPLCSELVTSDAVLTPASAPPAPTPHPSAPTPSMAVGAPEWWQEMSEARNALHMLGLSTAAIDSTLAWARGLAPSLAGASGTSTRFGSSDLAPIATMGSRSSGTAPLLPGAHLSDAATDPGACMAPWEAGGVWHDVRPGKSSAQGSSGQDGDRMSFDRDEGIAAMLREPFEDQDDGQHNGFDDFLQSIMAMEPLPDLPLDMPALA